MEAVFIKNHHFVLYPPAIDDPEQELLKVGVDQARSKELLQHEYAISQRLFSPRFRKALGLTTFQNRSALRLAYIQGESLDQLPNLGLPEFFELAKGCASALVSLQEVGIVHNKINLGNFVVSALDKQVVLIGFSCAETGSLPNSPFKDLKEIPREEIAFLSPELTGRTRRTIDHRSDIYSLGSVFYKMLTDTYPCVGYTPTEMALSIVSQVPTPVRWLNPEVPKAVEEIVMKMLAKSPEDRYQTAKGLLDDIEFCWQHLRDPESLLHFSIGQTDRTAKFQLSERLYGIEDETNLLANCLKTVLGGAKVFVELSGRSGTGKTALSLHLEDMAVKAGMQCISGKFDKDQQASPFYGVHQAIQQMTFQLLGQDEMTLLTHRTKLKEATGNIGKVLTDLQPEFEWIIGEQAPVPELKGAEAQHRLFYLLQRVIACMATPEQPLVLFLDDIQWADASSLQLVESLVAYPSIAHFMVITAYREEEKHQNEVLNAFLQKMHASGGSSQKIATAPLNRQDVRNMLQDTLPEAEVEALVDVVLNKTSGNPFFTHQFLNSLWEKGCLGIKEDGGWSYDLERINSMEASENVIDLIYDRIESLSPPCAEIVSFASCLGRVFKLEELSAILSQPLHMCQGLVDEAVQSGFIVRMDKQSFQFQHDRLRETFYESLSEEQREKHHSTIGWFYYRCEDIHNSPFVFEAAKHLRSAATLILPLHRKLLLDLLCLAGTKAKERAAFAPALYYFTEGIHFLQPADWTENYALTLSLYEGGAKSAAISGDRKLAESWSDQIIVHASSLWDRLKGYETKLLLLNENHELPQAIDLLLPVLDELGFSLSKKPNPLVVLTELLKTKLALSSKSSADILALPAMENEKAKAFMRLTVISTSAIFSAAPDMLPIVIFKQVQLSLKYGNSVYSPIAYVSYGFALASFLGNIKKGYEFGEMSLQLIKQQNAKVVDAKVNSVFYGFLSYWKTDMKEAILPLKQSWQTGRENGDLLDAAFCTTFHSSMLLFTGNKLPVVYQVMEQDSQLIKAMNQDLVYAVSEIQRQFVQHLAQGISKDYEIRGDEATEVLFVAKLKEKKDSASLFDFYIYKLILSFLLGDKQQAYLFSLEAQKNEDTTSAYQVTHPTYLLFSVLATLNRPVEAVTKKDQAHIKKALKRLKQIGTLTPENFAAKYWIANGQWALFQKSRAAAHNSFREAIQAANKSEFLHEEAIVYELWGEDHLAHQEWQIGEMFLQKAYESYARWGAESKCKQMREKYPAYFGSMIDISTPALEWDGEKLSEASVKIASETSLHGFLGRLAEVIDESLSPEKAMILVRSKEETLDLRLVSSHSKREFYEGTGKVDKEAMPLSLIYFLTRSKSPLYEEESLPHKFKNDPYFQLREVKSIMAIPLLNHTSLVGLIYCENVEPQHAKSFSGKRLLELLSPHIAVAMNNALLLEEQTKVRQIEDQYHENLLSIRNLAEEKERKRIAGDLHDDIGALLSTAKLYASHLQTDKKEEIVTRVTGLLDKAIENLREISHKLSPAHLERYGLKNCVTAMCEQVGQAGTMSVYFDCEEDKRMNMDQELNLYRVIQEMLNNAIKYSKATEVRFQLQFGTDNLRLEYNDNGIGFDKELVDSSQKGIGLKSMEQRIKMLKGNMEIRTKPGNGLQITVSSQASFLSN